MIEHLTDETIRLYLERRLESAELLGADEHLAVCDVCLEKAAGSGERGGAVVADILDSAEEELPAHLTYKQLESYVDEKANGTEREIAEVHLETCASCRTQLDELTEMRNLIAADLVADKVFAPRKNSALFGLGDLFFGKGAFRFALTAGAVLILSAAGILVWLVNRDTKTGTAGLSTPVQPVISPDRPVNLPVNKSENEVNSEQTNINTNVNPNVSPPPVKDKPSGLPPVYEEELRNVLAANRLNFPNGLDTLRSESGTLMGGTDEGLPFALGGPVGQIVLPNRPQFVWRPLKGAESYAVKIYDANFLPVAESPKLKGTKWKTNRPLTRGKTYIWQVTAFKDGEEIKSPVRPAPDARFKVLDAKSASELERLTRRYKDEHLFLGIKYAEAGLLAEAEREFRAELGRNPNSKTARKFLNDVRKR